MHAVWLDPALPAARSAPVTAVASCPHTDCSLRAAATGGVGRAAPHLQGGGAARLPGKVQQLRARASPLACMPGPPAPHPANACRARFAATRKQPPLCSLSTTHLQHALRVRLSPRRRLSAFSACTSVQQIVIDCPDSVIGVAWLQDALQQVGKAGSLRCSRGGRAAVLQQVGGRRLRCSRGGGRLRCRWGCGLCSAWQAAAPAGSRLCFKHQMPRQEVMLPDSSGCGAASRAR